MRKVPPILIITNKWDITTDLVVGKLAQCNANFHRINTEDLHQFKCSVCLPSLQFFIDSGSERICLTESKAIYYRRPGKPFQDCLTKENESIVEYASDQWAAFIQGLDLLKDAFWMNRPAFANMAESKICQLYTASSMGFTIPKTCITTSLEELTQFFSDCGGNVVAKALSAPLIENVDHDYFIFTNSVEKIENISLEELECCPTIFQEYLRVKIDIRVTVVGEKVFAVKIESTDGEKIEVDWRTLKDGVRFIPYELPATLNRLCIDFVKRMNLSFGAIDLIHANDNYYFLELNPSGEWGWLENVANIQISETIASELVNKSGVY